MNASARRPDRSVAGRSVGAVSNPPGDEPLSRFQSLRDRDSGAELDRTLYEGVPPHLHEPLATWTANAAGNRTDGQNAAKRALMRLRIPLATITNMAMQYDRRSVSTYGEAVHYIVESGHFPHDEELNVLNALIGLHDDEVDSILQAGWTTSLVELENLLVDAGSAWTVDQELRGLYRRVDATVIEARRTAEASAVAADRPTAAAHLRTAWQETYGVDPDPTKAYNEAVKAVEAAAAPAVAPKNPEPTLGQILGDMRAQGWNLALVDKLDHPWDAETFITLLDQLWRGRRAGHGGGANSRDQTQAEAEAAVHLAALAVQWFASNAVAKSTT